MSLSMLPLSKMIRVHCIRLGSSVSSEFIIPRSSRSFEAVLQMLVFQAGAGSAPPNKCDAVYHSMIKSCNRSVHIPGWWCGVSLPSRCDYVRVVTFSSIHQWCSFRSVKIWQFAWSPCSLPLIFSSTSMQGRDSRTSMLSSTTVVEDVLGDVWLPFPAM